MTSNTIFVNAVATTEQTRSQKPRGRNAGDGFQPEMYNFQSENIAVIEAINVLKQQRNGDTYDFVLIVDRPRCNKQSSNDL